MKFSLIMATINRTEEVKEFMESLYRQTYKNFELLIIDQNNDDCLLPIFEKYKSEYKIVHLRSKPGLSRARNVGLKNLTGDIVAFPDDDCIYPLDLLEKVKRWFEKHSEYSGLCGTTIDSKGKITVSAYYKNSGSINKKNIWRQANSVGLFIRVNTLNGKIFFDEQLGLGAETPWGSAEDIDFPLQIMSSGSKLYYDTSIKIIHPQVTEKYDKTAFRRGIRYGSGMGYVLRKYNYPFTFKVYTLIRPLGGAILSLLIFRLNKAYFHMMVFGGRIRGLLG